MIPEHINDDVNKVEANTNELIEAINSATATTVDSIIVKIEAEDPQLQKILAGKLVSALKKSGIGADEPVIVDIQTKFGLNTMADDGEMLQAHRTGVVVHSARKTVRNPFMGTPNTPPANTTSAE